MKLKEYQALEIGMNVALPISETGIELMQNYMENAIKTAARPSNIGLGLFVKMQADDLASTTRMFKNISKVTTVVDGAFTITFTGINTVAGIYENQLNGESQKEIISDAVLDIAGGAVSLTTTILLATYGTALAPGIGTLIGIIAGLFYEGVAWGLDQLI